MKTNGATPYQDAYDSTYSSELLPFGELVNWPRQAATEATEKAMDSLVAHGDDEDMKREDSKGFKRLTTR